MPRSRLKTQSKCILIKASSVVARFFWHDRLLQVEVDDGAEGYDMIPRETPFET